MRGLRYWWPAIAWAAVIWILSTTLGSEHYTSRFLFPILRWFFPGVSDTQLWHVHAVIRKAAHFVEYFIFSLLVLRGVRGEQSGWRWTWALATLAIAASYAALDEVHQAFVPARSASMRDTLLDTSGAAVAQVVAWWRARHPAPPIDTEAPARLP